MDLMSLAHRLAKRVVEPLAACTLIYTILFVILASKYDFNLDTNYVLLFSFIGIYVISLAAIIIYSVLMHRHTKPVGDAETEKLRQEVISLKEKLSLSEKARNWKEFEELVDIRSIDTDLDVPARFVDHDNFYSALEFNAEISVNGDYTGSYIRRGHRETEGKTSALYFRVGASSHIRDGSDLNLRATDLLTGRALNVTLCDDTDMISKVFKIELQKALPKGGKFEVQIDFFWPQCVTAQRDTDTINLTMFSLGVQRVTHTVKMPFMPQGVSLYQIKGAQVTYCSTDVDEGEDGGLNSLSYKVDRPDVSGYVLAFSKPLALAA